MRGPGILAIAIVLASSAPVPSRAQAPSPRSMEAAQALFGLLFAHGFVSLNAQAVELAWPGIEGAIRAQKPGVDAATLAELRREFERIRLARLHEITRDLPAIYARYLSAEEMDELAAFLQQSHRRENARNHAESAAGGIRQRASSHPGDDQRNAGRVHETVTRTRSVELGSPAETINSPLRNTAASIHRPRRTTPGGQDHEPWRARGPT
jgi:hypothetical protein